MIHSCKYDATATSLESLNVCGRRVFDVGVNNHPVTVQPASQNVIHVAVLKKNMGRSFRL